MKKTKTRAFNPITINALLIAVVILLCAIGFVFIYSASKYSAEVLYGDGKHFVIKQLIGFGIGLVAMILVSRFDYHKFSKLYIWIAVISIVMLVLVFIPGISISANGARRWIGYGSLSIQSSEVAKFGFVIFAAVYMSRNYKTMNTFRTMLPVVAVGGVICLLVLLEPNLSVTLCVGMVMLIMLFLGGINKKYFIMMLVAASLLVPVLIIIEPYRLYRLLAFINPWANPQDEGFQLIQSLYSLGAGGMFGVGIGNSMQKYLFLPFAESDFILAIIGEEVGFFGVAILFGLYVLLVSIGIKVAINASDRLGSLLAAGVTSLIACQTLINVAVVTGSIPPTGIPLPFISAGGSSLVVFLGAIGILLSISKSSQASGDIKANKLGIFNSLKISQKDKKSIVKP